MANIKSKIKRAKQAKVSELRNKQTKSLLKTKLRNFNEAVEANENQKAQEISKETVKILDKAASKGIIHNNKASSKKASMATTLNKMGAAKEEPAKTKAVKPKTKAKAKKEPKPSATKEEKASSE